MPAGLYSASPPRAAKPRLGPDGYRSLPQETARRAGGCSRPSRRARDGFDACPGVAAYAWPTVGIAPAIGDTSGSVGPRTAAPRRYGRRISPVARRVLDDDRPTDRPTSTTFRRSPSCRGITARRDDRQRHHRRGNRAGDRHRRRHETAELVRVSHWGASLAGLTRLQWPS